METRWEGLENLVNPEVLRQRLVSASLYLVAHELLVEEIVEPLEQFFSSKWSAKKGWHVDTEYRLTVLSLDPKGKEDRFRGSVEWLVQNGAIDCEDAQQIRDLSTERNKYAHELADMLSSGQLPDFTVFFPKIRDLVTKIGRWWIIEVEMASDPIWDRKEVDPNDLAPASSSFLHMLEKVALGQDDEAWEFFNNLSN